MHNPPLVWNNPVMRPAVLVLLVLVSVAGCTSSGPPAPSSTSPVPTTLSEVWLPPDPQPTSPGPCPYLDTTFVADTNGQRVSKVQTSPAEPHPACFFYALAGKLQLTARVYVGDPAVAKALVDHAAPVGTSNPATRPAGWQGGYQATGNGAVYAVAKQGAAVVVTTNQEQTVKARTVVEQVVLALGL